MSNWGNLQGLCFSIKFRDSLLPPTKRFPRHFYIHWPFCERRCNFCDFVACAGHKSFFSPYHQAILREIEIFFDSASGEKIKTKSIFIGGGTPSIYPIPMFKELFATLKEKMEWDDDIEVTMEVNPSGVTREILSQWRDFGVNRLSIGVQVLDDDVLKGLNRHQKTEDSLRVISEAAKIFDNISVDLILGLPGVNGKIWDLTLNSMAKLPISHISVYILTLYENTVLRHRVDSGEISLNCSENLTELYKRTVEFCNNRGFRQYEISNFAVPGFESIHNTAYWDRNPYKGFGLGASSFDGFKRWKNEVRLGKYIEADGKGAKKICAIEKLNNWQIFAEIIMLGLRKTSGIKIEELKEYLSILEWNLFMIRLNCMIREDLVRLSDDGNLSLTINGMIAMDDIVGHLCNCKDVCLSEQDLNLQVGV